MRPCFDRIALFCLLVCLFAGCGSSGSTGGGTPTPTPTPSPTATSTPTPTPAPVTLTLSSSGVATALQIGTGPFVTVPETFPFTFTLPSPTTKYTLVWRCGNPDIPAAYASVYEATGQDPPETVGQDNCQGVVRPVPTPTPSFGNATGSIDASAIPGAREVNIYDSDLGSPVTSTQAVSTFDTTARSGTSDFFFIVLDQTLVAVAAKILRGQTAPGSLNGGSTITFGPDDLFTRQPLSFTNLPPGVSSLFVNGTYYTGGGSLQLVFAVDPSTYLAIPAASTQNGDYYVFTASNRYAGSINAGTTQTVAGGGPVTIRLPDAPSPWSYSGPVPAAFPTFAFDTYPGFSTPMTLEQAQIQWLASPPPGIITLSVTATASYLNGAITPLTFPDVTAFWPGVPPLPSHTNVNWTAMIKTETGNPFLPRPNSSFVSVQSQGSYTTP